MYRNDYSLTTDKFTFTNVGVVSGVAKCTQGYGPGLYDLGVRFADITGDKKADYLCIGRDGTTTAFVNNGLSNFKAGVVVRKAAAVDRADIRFADVNGDGRADYIVIDKFTGAYSASINDNSTGAIAWVDKGVVGLGGRARGSSVYLASLNGTSRADSVIIDPATAIQNTYFNFCPTVRGLLGPKPLPLPIDPSNPASGKSTS
jgi:hypothetical protein